jgi:hypothetical protein
MRYQTYIVKKFYIPLEIEAESAAEAEEKAWEWMETNNQDGQFDSDDTYIHNGGEITA